MKQNRLFLPLYLLTMLLLFTGCSNEIHDDLSTYINVSLAEITTYEQEAIHVYNEVVSKEDINHEGLEEALETTIIPTYKNFLSLLQSVSPTTEEVDNLHHLYVQATKDQLKGFNLLKEGLKSNAPSKITKAEDFFKNSKQQIDAFKKELTTLAEQHNITY